jgi:hypothetical protein
MQANPLQRGGPPTACGTSEKPRRSRRILTISRPLRRDAEWTYGEIRWIMRFQNQAIASEMTLLQS